MRISKKAVAVVASVALLGGGATAAFAAIPDSGDSEYHACVADTGPVRAIYAIDKDASESCAAGYTEKTWSGAPAPEQPHVKIVQKTALSNSTGGAFGDYWSCGEGYTATAVGYRYLQVGGTQNSKLVLLVTDVGVNNVVGDAGPAAFHFFGRAVATDGSTTGLQVSVTVRATCISNVAYDGVTTS